MPIRRSPLSLNDTRSLARGARLLTVRPRCLPGLAACDIAVLQTALAGAASRAYRALFAPCSERQRRLSSPIHTTRRPGVWLLWLGARQGENPGRGRRQCEHASCGVCSRCASVGPLSLARLAGPCGQILAICDMLCCHQCRPAPVATRSPVATPHRAGTGRRISAAAAQLRHRKHAPQRAGRHAS